MSRRRGRSRIGRRWPWLLGALAGAALAYCLLRLRAPGGGAIPVPGEPAAAVGGPAPREEIQEADRDELERILRERAR